MSKWKIDVNSYEYYAKSVFHNTIIGHKSEYKIRHFNIIGIPSIFGFDETQSMQITIQPEH